jgi:EAL domain-containing protein (putative c-di-GMP-specific phosphodiesterase class I)/GGDEF domain-containing protein
MRAKSPSRARAPELRLPRLLNIPGFARPRGLAARAVLFTTALLVVTALISAATIVFGAYRESARHQLSVTGDLTEHLATVSGNFIAAGDLHELTMLVAVASSRHEVRRLSIRDAHGRPLAQNGGSATDAATADTLAARVAATGRPDYLRSTDGGLALGAPIVRGGVRLGVAVMMWNGDAYRFEALPALLPFVLILICITAAAVPLTAHVVRRAVAPLDELTRFAEAITAQGGPPAPLAIETDDEFETLGKAFNGMSERLQASVRHIQQMAFVDPATQLPNYDRFIREVDFFILRANAETGAVAVCELQRLPQLTQTLDPASTRDFLRVVAERFTSAVRTVDRTIRQRAEGEANAIAARLGITEFAAFAPGVLSPADVARFAQHLTAALNQPFEWRGDKFTLNACCGVAVAPRDGRDADAVIRHARMAVTAAQAAPSRVKVFTQSLDREAVARISLEREMRGALDNNEFRAHFQPKINLSTGRIEACEALARWVRPDRTIISPGRFIPVAEESGLIGPLSDAIMREACWKAASWARAGHPMKVAVNVSALQFRNERFAEQTLRILQHAGLPPAQLELEITESVAMEDPERALRAIQPLRDAGVRLAIDDFGCGHSSLAALSRLPFDVIKIDQQFVRALERSDPQAAAIVEMILALARTLHMEVVAEGVERREEADFMAARGCHWVQGFLFSAAVSAPEFAEMLRNQAGEDVVSEDAA